MFNVMSKLGPIIIVEDDEDDQFLLKESLEELRVENECVCFNNGQQALEYLLTTGEQPFLILCDINMPVMNGLELRDRIEASEYLRRKSIPFVFLSTSSSETLVMKAYESSIQGFYKKANGFEDFKEALKLITGYWRLCLHPNNLPGANAA